MLAFDFDGTLAPITRNPSEARMRAETAALFRTLCARYPVAVISGRARADVAARLDGAEAQWVVGNHGAEANGAPPPTFPREALREALGPLEGAYPGLWIEDKGHSLSVHLRQVTATGEATAALRRHVAPWLPELRLLGGKAVINVVPASAPTKGDALRRILIDAGTSAALYAGDDDTDEDVFRLPPASGIVSVRVGYAPRSAAQHFLRNQFSIDALLALLVSFRVVP